MRYLLTIVFLLLYSPVFAGSNFVPIVGQSLLGGAAADYAPATAHFAFGDASTGTAVKVLIYEFDDPNYTLLCSSSAITEVGNSVETASISGCGDLTPGNTYYVAYIGDGYIKPQNETATFQSRMSEEGTFASPAASLTSTTSPGSREPGIWITNSNSDVLVGDSNLADNTVTTSNDLGANKTIFYTAGYVCATL